MPRVNGASIKCENQKVVESAICFQKASRVDQLEWSEA